MIIAKRLVIRLINGSKFEYTHVTQVTAFGRFLTVSGECDDVDGSRFNASDKHDISQLDHTEIDWYIPEV